MRLLQGWKALVVAGAMAATGLACSGGERSTPREATIHDVQGRFGESGIGGSGLVGDPIPQPVTPRELDNAGDWSKSSGVEGALMDEEEQIQ